MTLKIAVLGSTNGSILPAVLKQLEEKEIAAQVQLVISNKRDAGIIDKAKQLQIPYQIITNPDLSRTSYDQQLTQQLEQFNIDLVLLIGFMRILSHEFVHHWHHKIINVHPSLLPRHAGLMNLAVHQAVIDANEERTGCSVHYVSEEVDGGPVLIQKSCSVTRQDTVETLKQKVQQLESIALVDAIEEILNAS